MKSNWITTCAAVALAAGSLIPGVASAAEEARGAVSAEAARARLLEMADTLGKAKAYSVEIHAQYDAVQPSGQKVEFSASREVLVRRPDGLRVDVESSDGAKSTTQFDGKTITTSSSAPNVYAQAEHAGTLDEAIRYFRQDLKMQLPLAAMLLTTFRQELENRLVSVEYVESTKRFGKEADHFAAQGTDVDAQFWVSVDDPPLCQRVVITYKNAEGQPQYAADFVDWDLTPSVSDSKFAFKADAGAQKIAFLPQLVARSAAPAPAAKEKKP